AAEIATASKVTTAAVVAATTGITAAVIGAAVRAAAGIAGIRAATAVIGAARSAIAVIVVDHGFAETRGHPSHAAVKAVGVAVPDCEASETCFSSSAMRASA